MNSHDTPRQPDSGIWLWLRRVQSTVGVSVLRGTASGNRDEAQGHGIRACSQGVRDQGCDDLIEDQGASAIGGDARRQLLGPPLDDDDGGIFVPCIAPLNYQETPIIG